MRRRRAGYSFIELLLVLIFIGLLARLALPRYGDMKRRAVATAIVADVYAIRLAAFTHYTEKQSWPPEYAAGVIPTELVSYLPENFTFAKPDYTFDYEVWTLSGGTPENPQQQEMLGVAVTVNDPKLAQAVLLVAQKGYAPIVSGNKVTFLLTGISTS